MAALKKNRFPFNRFMLPVFLVLITLTSCKKEIELPTVITDSVTGITPYTATVNTFVTSDGGASITVTGICWGNSYNPDLTANVINAGGTTGAFAPVISGLQPATTYHVRAFATNSAGTAYGYDLEFTTLN